jgi:Holliday junction resolvase
MGNSDGGFEYDIRDELRKSEEKIEADTSRGYLPERIPQSKYSKQHIDVVVYTPIENLHIAIECKSRKVGDGQPWKFYFNSHFREGTQIEEITEWLEKTGYTGYLAGAFRRGRGKKVKQYIIPWVHVVEIYENTEKTYISKEEFEKYGTEITESLDQFIEEFIN